MRHFLVALVGLFAILMMISMATEKPRQYKVAKSPEKITVDPPDAQALQGLPSPITPDSQSPSVVGSPAQSAASKPVKAPPNATAIAYSRNDVGGKIVLTTNACEKNTGLNAYTTHPDGAVDFGCWLADELFVLIHWDKAGLQNYSHDRFQAAKSNERLAAGSLLEMAREPLSRFNAKPPSSLVRKPNGS
jgi:hypothetical protein